MSYEFEFLMRFQEMPILLVKEPYFENHGSYNRLLCDCVKGMFCVTYIPQELWVFPNSFMYFFWMFLERMSSHKSGRVAHFDN